MATLESIKAKIRKLINSANAVTGNSDSDLTTAVNVLVAGYMTGDSTEYYRYITFMDTDYETVASNVSVAPKYSCDRSVAPALTKESTVDTVYTLAGWSLTPDGPIQTGVLNNIRENITMYPVFEPSIRYYTIRFFDGETLLKTEQIPYGESSSYLYEKIGAYFHGWNPKPVNVSSDLDCYGNWEFASFATDSWDQIAKNSKADAAEEYYTPGDVRELTLNFADGHSETMIIQIAGFRKDILSSDNTRKAGMSIIAKTALSTPMAYCSVADNTGDYTSGGFESSDIYKYLITTVWPALPSDLRNCIESVSKGCSRWDGSKIESYNLDCSIWIPNLSEIASSIFSDGSFVEYSDVYTRDTGNITSTYVNESRLVTLDGVTVPYWVRTIFNEDQAYRITENGLPDHYAGINDAAATRSNYIVFGFCI